MKKFLLTAPSNFKKQTKKVVSSLLLLLMFCSYNSGYSQVSNYQLDQLTITPTPFTFLPGGYTNLFPASAGLDNGVSTVALPFSFQFNGSSYASINISLNGFVTFGTAPVLTEVTPISSATAYSGVISPFGMDLDLFPATATTRNVSYLNTGVAGSQIFKIQWNVKRSNNLGTIADAGGNDTTFQVWLYEGTNVIEMHYAINNTTSTFNALAQIGLRGASNTDYKNLNFTAGLPLWPSLTTPTTPTTMPLGTVNTAQVLFRDTCRPDLNANRTFRWTPVTCFAPSALNITLGSLTYNSATLNWTASVPAPANGYEYYVTTSSTAPVLATVATGSVGAGVLTTPISFASPGTLYYIYVRSVCSGTSTSAWSTVLNVTPFCTPLNVPYLQEFDNGVGTNAVSPYHTGLPTCTTQQNAGLGNNWVTSNQDLYYTNAGMSFNILMYNGQSPGNANPANVWFYTEGINLTAGTTYTLNYLYGGTSTPSTVQNKMKVAYGTYPNSAYMTTILDDHPNIKGSPFSNTINFTAPSTGVFYFGYQAYSNANNGQLYVDDVQVYPSVCLKPTVVSVSSITYNSGVLNWTAPAPAPASGYAYYLSTSATTPTNSTVPTGFTATGVTNVTINGLSGSTNYYFWVRTNCGSGNYGEWVALNNSGSPFFTTLVAPPAYCTPASTSTASFINNFTTTGGYANINNSSGYTAGGYASYLTQVVSQSPGANVNFTVGISGPTVGVAIWVDWNNNGVFDNTVYNNPGNLTGEKMFTTTGYVTTLSSNFSVPAGQATGNYRMRVLLDFFATGPSPCAFSATGPRGEAEDYIFTVRPTPPALAINSSTSTQCASNNSPTILLTTPVGNFNTYSWSPSTGVTGNELSGWIINTNSTITYTLTGSQNVFPFSTNTATYTYVANQPPTPIIITTPSGTVACPANSTPGLPINATGGIVSGVSVLSENFNTGAVGWTTVNNSSGTNPGNATLLLQPAGYNPGGSSGISSVNSNDNSTCVVSNSDSQGSAGITNVELISPVFSLAGYTSADLSFYHFVRFFTFTSSPAVNVLISTDGGVTYPTVLQNWTGTSANPVAPYAASSATNFGNTIINISSYVGQTNLRIKFVYTDRFGYIWAIDNFLVSGSASSSVTWNTQSSPVANGVAVPGLYTTAAGTTAYIAGTGAATVYALPAANTTFTASASTPTPVCSTISTVPITIAVLVPGNASGSQTTCNGTVTDLTVAGYTGSVVNWQSADNATFTVGLYTYPASGFATLTTAQIGSINATKYFRATTTNGTCTIYSNVITVTLSTTVWNGSVWSNGTPNNTTRAEFQGNFTSSINASGTAGNLSACSVIVTSGTVLFNKGTLTVQNQVSVVGGSLTFDDVSFDVSLYQPNNVANGAGVYSGGNTGNITFKRTSSPMFKFDYTYWSSPVYPQNLLAVSPGSPANLFLSYNNAWQYIASPSTTTMTPAKGYAIRAPLTFNVGPIPPATAYQATFTPGVPNNGDISIPILGGAAQMNFLGNPYPSALSGSQFITANPGVNGSLYFWTHNTPINTSYQYTQNDYAIFNLTGGTIAAPNSGAGNNTPPTGNIASGQGFFVKGLTGGNANFTNAMRVSGNNSQFFRTTTDQELEKNRYWLDITNSQGAFKQALVGYIETATLEIDRLFDADMVDVGNVISLYTKVDNNKLSIQGRPLPFDVADTVPLSYKSTIATTYTINIPQYDGLFTSQHVYLEDTVLNVIHDLTVTPYTFATEIGTFDDRFVLRYTEQALGNPTFDENSVVVFKNNQGLFINSGNEIMKSVTIYDIRGRVLATKMQVGTTETVFTTLPTTQEVLLVKIEGVNGGVVTKKVVY